MIGERCDLLESKLEQMSQSPFVTHEQLASVVSDSVN